MKQESGIVNTIENIFDQVGNTTIDTGKSEGHYISSAQFGTLRESVDSLVAIARTATAEESSPSKASTPSTVSLAKGREPLLQEQLRVKEIELSAATPANRVRLNEELGQLKSERARIVGLTRRVEDIDLA